MPAFAMEAKLSRLLFWVLPTMLSGLLTAQLPPRQSDVVKLRNGDELVGRVTQQLDGYVEIELAAGATVGLSRAQVLEIQLAAVANPVAPAPAVPAQDQWFVLRDATGAAIGWLHATQQPQADGGLQIGEEYEFQERNRRYQITTLVRADRHLQPSYSYFRERISEPQPGFQLGPAELAGSERIRAERIVEATVQDGKLTVLRLDQRGRREELHDWPAATSFPPLARLAARLGQQPAELVYDPAAEEFRRSSYAAPRWRTIQGADGAQEVREIAEQTATGHNREWVDARGAILRRELAGPALVALAAGEASAVAAASLPPAAAAMLRSDDGQLGLWLPNPQWQAVAGTGEQIALRSPLHEAAITLSRIDQLPNDATLPSAAAAVANWWRLLHPEAQLDQRGAIDYRGQRGLRLLVRDGTGATRGWLDVIEAGSQFLLLRCEAAPRFWEELLPDFEFVQRSLELRAQPTSPALPSPGSGNGPTSMAGPARLKLPAAVVQ